MYIWQNIQKRIIGIKNPIGAEIGVYQGNLSRLLLENIPNLTLYMIDAWSLNSYPEHTELHKKYDLCSEENYKITCGIVKKYHSRARILRMTSLQAANITPLKFFDFVLLDANHEYAHVAIDIFEWLPKVKQNGWICGHDYGSLDWPGVKKAVDEIFPDAEIDTDFTWFWKVK